MAAITLPDTDTWTQPEVVRALRRIESKLDSAATVQALETVRAEAYAARESMKRDQQRKDDEQDKAIEATEQNYNKLLLMVLGSGLAGVTSIIVAVAGAGPR